MQKSFITASSLALLLFGAMIARADDQPDPAGEMRAAAIEKADLVPPAGQDTVDRPLRRTLRDSAHAAAVSEAAAAAVREAPPVPPLPAGRGAVAGSAGAQGAQQGAAAAARAHSHRKNEGHSDDEDEKKNKMKEQKLIRPAGAASSAARTMARVRPQ
ncbi:MAG: hypothetical protein EXR72_14740 [Myxococcales bacterium]|nr:hypothetical protein [Myxococcales bacterium]